MGTADEIEAKRTGAADIHDLLRDRICLLEYQPGTMLRENELATEFNVSRTPVREALQRLSIEGLVEVRNGIGTFVTTLDAEDLRDVYTLRVEMALLFGRMQTRAITRVDVSVLEELLSRSRALVGSIDLNEHWKINHELHFAISDIIQNKSFLATWHNLYFRAARAWYDVSKDVWADAVHLLQAELTDLSTAAREGDVAAVGYIKRNYIKYCWQRVDELAASKYA